MALPVKADIEYAIQWVEGDIGSKTLGTIGREIQKIVEDWKKLTDVPTKRELSSKIVTLIANAEKALSAQKTTQVFAEAFPILQKSKASVLEGSIELIQSDIDHNHLADIDQTIQDLVDDWKKLSDVSAKKELSSKIVTLIANAEKALSAQKTTQVFVKAFPNLQKSKASVQEMHQMQGAIIQAEKEVAELRALRGSTAVHSDPAVEAEIQAAEDFLNAVKSASSLSDLKKASSQIHATYNKLIVSRSSKGALGGTSPEQTQAQDFLKKYETPSVGFPQATLIKARKCANDLITLTQQLDHAKKIGGETLKTLQDQIKEKHAEFEALKLQVDEIEKYSKTVQQGKDKVSELRSASTNYNAQRKTKDVSYFSREAAMIGLGRLFSKTPSANEESTLKPFEKKLQEMEEELKRLDANSAYDTTALEQMRTEVEKTSESVGKKTKWINDAAKGLALPIAAPFARPTIETVKLRFEAAKEKHAQVQTRISELKKTLREYESRKWDPTVCREASISIEETVVCENRIRDLILYGIETDLSSLTGEEFLKRVEAFEAQINEMEACLQEATILVDEIKTRGQPELERVRKLEETAQGLEGKVQLSVKHLGKDATQLLGIYQAYARSAQTSAGKAIEREAPEIQEIIESIRRQNPNKYDLWGNRIEDRRALRLDDLMEDFKDTEIEIGQVDTVVTTVGRVLQGLDETIAVLDQQMQKDQEFAASLSGQEKIDALVIVDEQKRQIDSLKELIQQRIKAVCTTYPQIQDISTATSAKEEIEWIESIVSASVQDIDSQCISLREMQESEAQKRAVPERLEKARSSLEQQVSALKELRDRSKELLKTLQTYQKDAELKGVAWKSDIDVEISKLQKLISELEETKIQELSNVCELEFAGCTPEQDTFASLEVVGNFRENLSQQVDAVKTKAQEFSEKIKTEIKDGRNALSEKVSEINDQLTAISRQIKKYEKWNISDSALKTEIERVQKKKEATTVKAQRLVDEIQTIFKDKARDPATDVSRLPTLFQELETQIQEIAKCKQEIDSLLAQKDPDRAKVLDMARQLESAENQKILDFAGKKDMPKLPSSTAEYLSKLQTKASSVAQEIQSLNLKIKEELDLCDKDNARSTTALEELIQKKKDLLKASSVGELSISYEIALAEEIIALHSSSPDTRSFDPAAVQEYGKKLMGVLDQETLSGSPSNREVALVLLEHLESLTSLTPDKKIDCRALRENIRKSIEGTANDHERNTARKKAMENLAIVLTLAGQPLEMSSMSDRRKTTLKEQFSVVVDASPQAESSRRQIVGYIEKKERPLSSVSQQRLTALLEYASTVDPGQRAAAKLAIGAALDQMQEDFFTEVRLRVCNLRKDILTGARSEKVNQEITALYDLWTNTSQSDKQNPVFMELREAFTLASSKGTYAVPRLSSFRMSTYGRSISAFSAELKQVDELCALRLSTFQPSPYTDAADQALLEVMNVCSKVKEEAKKSSDLKGGGSQKLKAEIVSQLELAKVPVELAVAMANMEKRIQRTRENVPRLVDGTIREYGTKVLDQIMELEKAFERNRQVSGFDFTREMKILNDEIQKILNPWEECYTLHQSSISTPLSKRWSTWNENVKKCREIINKSLKTSEDLDLLSIYSMNLERMVEDSSFEGISTTAFSSHMATYQKDSTNEIAKQNLLRELDSLTQKIQPKFTTNLSHY